MAAKFHFAENALALHLLFERLESLVDVVIADENLHRVVILLSHEFRNRGSKVPVFKAFESRACSRSRVKSPPSGISSEETGAKGDLGLFRK
jgi:hypothetical protein